MEGVKKTAYGARMTLSAWVVSVVIAQGGASSAPTAVMAPATSAPSAQIGAVAAPAALPAGALAFYGLLGAPEVGGGFRQGFAALELEARALFNYLTVSFLLEGGAKVGLLRVGRVTVAPGLAVGFVGATGTRYYDRANFPHLGLRPRVSATASYAFSEAVVGLALLDVPWTIALNVQGFELTPTVGAGAEFHVGGRLSILATAHLGLDAIKEPLGVTQLRPAWGVRLGVGYRAF